MLGLEAVVEALSKKVEMIRMKDLPSPLRMDSSEQRLTLIANAMPLVDVIRPRQLLPESVRSQLKTATLSELSRSLLDCYDLQWTGDSDASIVPPFVTDLPERRGFTIAARSILGQLNGQLPFIPEQNGALVTGPVGCGKTTLARVLALTVAAMNPNSVLIHSECKGDTSAVLPSLLIAAGLVKSGAATEEEVMRRVHSIPALRDLATEKRLRVVFFVDEAQLLFQAPNVPIVFEANTSTRAEVLAGEMRFLESDWPRSFVSGGASSLKNLLYQPSIVSASLFPSKMLRSLNNTKFLKLELERLCTPTSVIPVAAELEREFQLAARAKSEPSLDRDHDTGLLSHSSETNRVWMRKNVEELSDLTTRDEHADRTRAVAYLRRFLGHEVEDEDLLFFIALLYSRGVPRLLKGLQSSAMGPLSSIQSFIPEDVRTLWLQMAEYLLLHSGRREELNRRVSDIEAMDFATLDVTRFSALAFLRINIPDLVKSVPSAASGSFPSRDTLADFVDRGYILWNESLNIISFASVADFALTRLSLTLQVRQFELLALLFNILGEEHERIAVASIKDAVVTRYGDARVRAVLNRLGLVTGGESGELRDLTVLWNRQLVYFLPVKDFRMSGTSVGRTSEPKRSKSEPGKDAGEEPRPRTDGSVEDPLFIPNLSTIGVLMAESKRSFAALVTSGSDAWDEIVPGSLMHHFATTGEAAGSRTVHEAFGLERVPASHPVMFKPTPDDFKIDWIIVNPDGTIAVMQMKHGASKISEEATVAELTAGARVLRAWLGHRGVTAWETVPIRRIVWCLRPTSESLRKKPVPTGDLARSVGVEWLDKYDVAPVWTDDVIQVLFHNFKESMWGVEGERKRAKVERMSDVTIASSLRAVLGEVAPTTSQSSPLEPKSSASTKVDVGSTPRQPRAKRSDAGKPRRPYAKRGK